MVCAWFNQGNRLEKELHEDNGCELPDKNDV